MSDITAIIVDDEQLARERVRTLLSAAGGVKLVAECDGGRAAVEAIETHRPDLAFLDVQMPDFNGFEVLEAVERDRLPGVVFVTAYDEYALRAFEVHALDYLLKPIDAERFEAALRHAVDAIRGPAEVGTDRRLLELLDALGEREQRLDRLVVRAQGKIFFLKPAEIDWIEADGKYARLHVGREAHTVRYALKRLAVRLREHGFVRVHRSAIVNADRIKELQPWFHGEYVVVLRDGTKLTSSSAHSEDLHKLVGKTV